MNKTALSQSIIIHTVIVTLMVFITIKPQQRIYEEIEFEIIEKEIINIRKKPNIVINATKPPPAVLNTPPKEIRQVFGINRKAIVDNEKGNVVVKKGNTLTKKEDNKVLKDDDPDSLPEPAEEFLITSMPKAQEEFRPEYPQWAKDQGISGSVIFEILIDKTGKVRSAKLLKSLHPELDKLAEVAMKKFKFKPGFIEKEPVPVRIRYAIRFILES